MPDTEPAHPAAVIELRGELDITSAVALGTVLSAAVSREPAIEVDLSPRRSWDTASLPFWIMRWTV